MLKQTLALVGLTLSLSANAVIVNTLGGVDYEWLELSHTQGLSRDAVEARLLDSNDELYGYQYASRAQVEALFLSYASFDGVSGWHGDASVVTGVIELINDFGATEVVNGPGHGYFTTVDVGEVWYSDSHQLISGFYGLATECTDALYTCRADVVERGTMVYQGDGYGFDADDPTPNFNLIGDTHVTYASFLVAPAAVPVPAAGWLFMSALIGLVGKKRLSR